MAKLNNIFDTYVCVIATKKTFFNVLTKFKTMLTSGDWHRDGDEGEAGKKRKLPRRTPGRVKRPT